MDDIMKNINFLEFLQENDIDVKELPKLVTIINNYDDSCDMVQIHIENTCVHGGNTSDIYDGCMPHAYIGDYENVYEFLNCLKNGLLDLGFNVTFKRGII